MRMVLFLLSLGGILTIIGAILNLTVLYSNNWKMPVLNELNYDSINSKRHILFNDKKEVKLWFLCDIFIIQTETRNHHLSIGDLFLLCGVSASVLSMATMGVYFIISFVLNKRKIGSAS